MQLKTLALLASLSLTLIPGFGFAFSGSRSMPIVGLAFRTPGPPHPERNWSSRMESVTGYAWRIDQTIDQTILLPDGSKFTQTSQQRSRGEQVGTQLLRFVAQQPGRTRLRMVYTNVQEGIIEGTPRYDLEVIVAPKPVAAQ